MTIRHPDRLQPFPLIWSYLNCDGSKSTIITWKQFYTSSAISKTQARSCVIRDFVSRGPIAWDFIENRVDRKTRDTFFNSRPISIVKYWISVLESQLKSNISNGQKYLLTLTSLLFYSFSHTRYCNLQNYNDNQSNWIIERPSLFLSMFAFLVWWMMFEIELFKRAFDVYSFLFQCSQARKYLILNPWGQDSSKSVHEVWNNWNTYL